MFFTLIFIISIFLFSSAQNISERNFDSECGQVFMKKQFVIESTSYPSNYPTNYQCSYLIKGPSCPTHFNLQLLDFNLEDSLGCAKDRLEIGDKDALCGNASGIKNYFSKTGTLILRFVSDGQRTGRGYRILVTRQECDYSEYPENSLPTTTPVPKWYTTNRDVEYTTTTQRPSVAACCQNFFSQKQFILTSPNFPHSMSSEIDCSYEIRKTNNDICRLRFHFKFFYLSGQNMNCQGGFLQIDDKYICGCKSELKIISPFNSDRKILRFVSRGYEKSSYSGFVVEVIQDECPKRLVPENNTKENNNTITYRFDNDEINKVDNSQGSIIEKLHLIREKTEIVPLLSTPSDNSSDNITERKFDTQIVKHVYFFGEEPEREETNYVDTSVMTNQVFEDFYGFNYCLNWNRQQFLNVQNIPASCTSVRFNQNNNHIEPNNRRDCVELGYLRGYFKSPGYPFYYPGNVNVCYRFKAVPGYCSIRMYMKDFNVEDSRLCRKDYFLVDKNKYCGSRLASSVLHFNMGHGNYKEMNFVTDAFYCGRGFFGTYEQIACQDMTYPINPTVPPLTPTTPQPFPCSWTFQQEIFTIQLNAQSQPQCTFTIKKYSPDVCRIRLYFEQFELFCAYESILIDGMMYCGHLTGQSVNIDVRNREPVIIYKKRNGENLRSKLIIQGLQIRDECIEPEVPPERLLDPRSMNYSMSQPLNFTYFLKISKHKEICGLITNTTEIDLPKTFCEFLLNNINNITECIPLPENSLFVPSSVEPQRIELKVGDEETIEEIEFNEIECSDNMPPTL